jgi:hypothetical protein
MMAFTIYIIFTINVLLYITKIVFPLLFLTIPPTFLSGTSRFSSVVGKRG